MSDIPQKHNRKKPGVYKITSELNPAKIYIGCSKNVSRRLSEHKKALKAGNHKNPHLQSHFNKYHDLKFSLIALCPDENLIELEQLLLDEYSEIKQVFNVNKNCERSRLGIRHTEESKLKMSQKLKGRIGPWQGKKFSLEHRKNISKGRAGLVSGSLGTKRNDAFKASMSILKSKWISQHDLSGKEIARFHGIKTASKQLGFSVNCLRKGLKKGQRKGFKWEYVK